MGERRKGGRRVDNASGPLWQPGKPERWLRLEQVDNPNTHGALSAMLYLGHSSGPWTMCLTSAAGLLEERGNGVMSLVKGPLMRSPHTS